MGVSVSRRRSPQASFLVPNSGPGQRLSLPGRPATAHSPLLYTTNRRRGPGDLRPLIGLFRSEERVRAERGEVRGREEGTSGEPKVRTGLVLPLASAPSPQPGPTRAAS